MSEKTITYNKNPKVWIIAILIFALSVGVILWDTQKSKDWAETTGVITKINHDNFNNTYTVHIDYEIDGNTYSATINEYNFLMRFNKNVKILYNQQNPYDIKLKSNIAIVVVSVIGVVFIICAAAALVNKLKNKEEI